MKPSDGRIVAVVLFQLGIRTAWREPAWTGPHRGHGSLLLPGRHRLDPVERRIAVLPCALKTGLPGPVAKIYWTAVPCLAAQILGALSRTEALKYGDAFGGREGSIAWIHSAETCEIPSLHKYLYVHGEPVQGLDPSGLMFGGLSGMVATIAIGVTALAGLTIAWETGLIGAPDDRPGFFESLVPLWGSGKAYQQYYVVKQ